MQSLKENLENSFSEEDLLSLFSQLTNNQPTETPNNSQNEDLLRLNSLRECEEYFELESQRKENESTVLKMTVESAVFEDSSNFSEFFRASAETDEGVFEQNQSEEKNTPTNANSFCFESDLSSKKSRNSSSFIKEEDKGSYFNNENKGSVSTTVNPNSFPTSFAFLQSLMSSIGEIEGSELIVNKREEPSEKVCDKREEPSEQLFDKREEPSEQLFDKEEKYSEQLFDKREEPSEQLFDKEEKYSEQFINKKDEDFNRNDYYLSLEQNYNPGMQIETGFTTANNTKIYVNAQKLEEAKINFESFSQNNKNFKFDDKKLHFGLSSQNSEIFNFSNKKIPENVLVSGFVTGNNKPIFIKESDLPDSKPVICNENHCSFKEIENENNSLKESPRGIKAPLKNMALQRTEERNLYRIALQSKEFSKHHTIRRYNIPETGHSSTKSKEDIRMIESFEEVSEYFKKEDPEWVFTQFKWTWLYFHCKNSLQENDLSDQIIDTMKLRMKYEHSVLRRIVEFDDMASKFMVLGLISYSESHAEVFDGFYSISVEIDKRIFEMFKKANYSLGSKFFVFGSQLVIKEPTSIFELKTPALRLFYNSVKLCSNDFKLGTANKITFLNKITDVHPEGGTISCLVVNIKKIIEIKYLVTVDSYRNRVDDLEKEIEKIFEIAEKIGHKIEMNNISSCKFCKAVIEDETGECLLTWWSPPDIKVGEKYKLIYLSPVAAMGKHVSTSRKTYWEKVV